MKIHHWLLTSARILAAAPAFADLPVSHGCARQRLEATRPLNGANTAQISLDSSFPNSFEYAADTAVDNLRNKIKTGLVAASLKWNSGCGPSPILNNHPLFYVADAPSSGGATQENILVKFYPPIRFQD